MADVVLNGAFLSSSNIQLRFKAANGGSILLTSFDSLKVDDEIDPVLVHALGSYGPIGATEGTYKVSGASLGAPVQIMQYLWGQLAKNDPTGTNSPGKTVFGLSASCSNGIDPTYKLEVRGCRGIKLGDEFKAGDGKQLMQEMAILVGAIPGSGVYRNGIRILNPDPSKGIA